MCGNIVLASPYPSVRYGGVTIILKRKPPAPEHNASKIERGWLHSAVLVEEGVGKPPASGQHAPFLVSETRPEERQGKKYWREGSQRVGFKRFTRRADDLYDPKMICMIYSHFVI